MKKVFGLIIVLTLLINNLVIVKAETIQVPQGTVLSCYTDDDIKRAADEIFVDMNPKEGTTKDIVTLYKGGRYKEH